MDYKPCFSNFYSNICKKYVEDCTDTDLCRSATNELKGVCKCKHKRFCHVPRQQAYDELEECPYKKKFDELEL